MAQQATYDKGSLSIEKPLPATGKWRNSESLTYGEGALPLFD